jgi:hypothetical protein
MGRASDNCAELCGREEAPYGCEDEDRRTPSQPNGAQLEVPCAQAASEAQRQDLQSEEATCVIADGGDAESQMVGARPSMVAGSGRHPRVQARRHGARYWNLPRRGPLPAPVAAPAPEDPPLLSPAAAHRVLTAIADRLASLIKERRERERVKRRSYYAAWWRERGRALRAAKGRSEEWRAWQAAYRARNREKRAAYDKARRGGL